MEAVARFTSPPISADITYTIVAAGEANRINPGRKSSAAMPRSRERANPMSGRNSSFTPLQADTRPNSCFIWAKDRDAPITKRASGRARPARISRVRSRMFGRASPETDVNAPQKSARMTGCRRTCLRKNHVFLCFPLTIEKMGVRAHRKKVLRQNEKSHQDACLRQSFFTKVIKHDGKTYITQVAVKRTLHEGPCLGGR